MNAFAAESTEGTRYIYDGARMEVHASTGAVRVLSPLAVVPFVLHESKGSLAARAEAVKALPAKELEVGDRLLIECSDLICFSGFLVATS